MRRSLWFLIAVLVLAGALALSWRPLAVRLLTQEMGRRGVVVESFTLGGVSLNGVEFRNVVVRRPVSILLPSLALGLSEDALLHGQWNAVVSAVTVESVDLALVQDAEGWHLNAVPLPKSEGGKRTDLLALLALFPSIEIRKATLHLLTPDQEITAPLALSSHVKDRRLQLVLSAEPLQAKQGDMTFRAGKLHMQVEADIESKEVPKAALRIEKAEWSRGRLKANARRVEMDAMGGMSDGSPDMQVSLNVPEIMIQGVPSDLAKMNLAAACHVTAEAYDCDQIVAQAPANALYVELSARGPYDPARAEWHAGGRVNLYDGALNFTAAPARTGLQPVKVVLMAVKLQLQPVLSLLAEGQVTAQSTLSGSIPLVWNGGQNITIGQGNLHSDGPGILHLSPQLLHMDNPQIAMVSGILADFRFEHLGIDLQGMPQGGLKAKLSLLGHNPAEWNGRSVKLNVTLGGDLLSLLKQSILPMSDPRQWLSNPPPSSPPSH